MLTYNLKWNRFNITHTWTLPHTYKNIHTSDKPKHKHTFFSLPVEWNVNKNFSINIGILRFHHNFYKIHYNAVYDNLYVDVFFSSYFCFCCCCYGCKFLYAYAVVLNHNNNICLCIHMWPSNEPKWMPEDKISTNKRT